MPTPGYSSGAPPILNDLLLIGASHERGFLSLLILPPTF
jgi:hypothetical protein